MLQKQIKRPKNLAQSHRQFVLYAVIGLSGVALDFVIYTALVELAHVPPVVANFISISLAILNNFLLNRRYTFKVHDHMWKRFAFFYAVGFVGILLSDVLLVILHYGFNIDAVLAKLLTLPVILIAQFELNKKLSFGDMEKTLARIEMARHKFPRYIKLAARTLITKRALFIAAVVALCFLAGIIEGPRTYFVDEHDNLLGGQFIAHGGVLYRDYFSHHMPLAYFVAAPFMAVFGMHLVLVKMAFGAAMVGWILVMGRHVYRYKGFAAWAVFVTLLSVIQSSSFANLLLGETLIGYATCHLFILLYFRQQIAFGYRTILAYSLLSAVPVLSSASYIWLSLIGYLMMMAHGWTWLRPRITRAWLWRALASLCLLAIPYALLLGYLLITRGLHAFIFQAFTFNVRYYSIFTGEVSADGPVYSLLGQLLNAWKGLEQVLLSPHHGLALLATFFTLGLILVIITWLKGGQRLAAMAAMLLILFSSIRGAFSNVLQNGSPIANTRMGIPLVALGMGIFVLAWTELRRPQGYKQKTPVDLARVASLYVGSFLVLIGILSAGRLITNISLNHRHENLVMIGQSADAQLINAINGTHGYYWVGPIDFYAQIQIESSNASKYRFFLPWHGICPSCTTELVSDLRQHQPSVIFYNQDLPIWAHTPREYAKPVGDYIDSHYFTSKDPQLKHYYFNDQDKQQLQRKLTGLGYSL